MTIDLLPTVKSTSWSAHSPVRDESYSRCFQNYYHAHGYLRPRPQYIPLICSTVKHWQLRDLIQYDPSNDSVYYARGRGIGSYQTQNHTTQMYMELPYLPPCFSHAGDGAVVAGGLLTSTGALNSQHLPTILNSTSRTSKGLFSFYHPSMDNATTVRLGEMINNDVAVYRSGDHYDAYVCNNEGNLYEVDVANSGKIAVKNRVICEHNMCLNHVARNPVHKLVLGVTGDCGQIFLVENNKVVTSIRTEQDFGFGTTFHPNGYLMSTVFQNGTCLLYDLRNVKDSEPLLTVRSTRPFHRAGAFRVCKFSPADDLNDLLIILEHVGRVHVLDLRTASNDNVDDHQVIVVPSALDLYAMYSQGKARQSSTGLDGLDLEGSIDGSKDFDSNEDFTNKGMKESKSSRTNSLNLSNSLSSLNSFSHPPVDVYGEEPDFPTSLVWDYKYLRSFPKLFDDFVFVPPPKSTGSPDYIAPPKFNYPLWNGSGNGVDNAVSVSPTEPRNDVDMQYVYDNLDEPPSSRHSYGFSAPEPMNYASSCNERSVNGEMLLSGIEFCPRPDGNLKILIGCKMAGILSWDVNSDSRRSFGSCEFI